MANQDSNRTIQTAEFNSATLKLEGAKALISTIGIFIDEAGEEMPVTGQLLARAMNGSWQSQPPLMLIWNAFANCYANSSEQWTRGNRHPPP